MTHFGRAITVMMLLASATADAQVVSPCDLAPDPSPPDLTAPVGIIRGVILDADTKRPLPYANAMVVGTTCGAMTKEDGTFTILRVPPGVHEVKVMMIGYRSTSIDSVVVRPYDETHLPPLLVLSMGPRWPDSEAAERSIVGTETLVTAADIRCEVISLGGNTFHIGDMPTFKVVMRSVGRESFYLVRELDKSFYGYRYPKMSMTIEGPGRGPTRLGPVCGNTNNPEPSDFVLVHPDETFQPFDVYVSYDAFAQPGQYKVTFTYDTDAIDYMYWVDRLNYHGMHPRAYMLLKQVPRVQLSQTIAVDVVE